MPGIPVHARRGILDRVLNLVANHLPHGRLGHAGGARAAETVVEVGPDHALRPGRGERVARAAPGDEELLAACRVGGAVAVADAAAAGGQERRGGGRDDQCCGDPGAHVRASLTRRARARTGQLLELLADD